METFGNQILPKFCPKYYCKNCDYGTCKKSSYDSHNLSAKHQKTTKGNHLETAGNQILPKICLNFACANCNKEFKNRSGLWKHNKICIKNLNSSELSQETILNILNQNSELHQMLLEQNKTIIELCKEKNNINNFNSDVNINSNNRTFNLQIFLNEHCKDAMNIMDFVDSVKLQLSDLENVGKLGFIEGISNIIVKNLKALDIHKRPVHCSDSKREVMYIKDEDKWERENEEKVKLRKVIKYIAHKNTKLIPEFKAKYPDCGKSDSKKSDQYNKLIIEAMGGSGDNDNEKEDKIIKKIAKEVTIDKN